ncbi:MAG: hypothetical protein O3A00_11040 [Planctomycetota bacterium]|nr:hypothetical protein [Planctomycetota bacterium]
MLLSDYLILQVFRKVLELIPAEFRPLRITRNVVTQEFELIVTSDEMIESVLLPESTLALQLAVNLGRGEVLPRFALSQHRVIVRERGQDMHVVWHDYEISQLVTVSVEVTQTARHNIGWLDPTKDALSVALIERIVPAIRKCRVKLSLYTLSELLQPPAPVVRHWVDAMLPQKPPSISEPSFEYRSWNRVRRSKRDKAHRTSL